MQESRKAEQVLVKKVRCSVTVVSTPINGSTILPPRYEYGAFVRIYTSLHPGQHTIPSENPPPESDGRLLGGGGRR